MSEIAQEQAEALTGHLAHAAAAVLSQIAGEELQAEAMPMEAPAENGTGVQLELSGALVGSAEIVLSPLMSAHFAAMLTGEAVTEPVELTPESREAAVELIQQICGNTADRLRRSFGALELKCAGRRCSTDERATVGGVRRLVKIPRNGQALEFELHIVALQPAAQAAVAASSAEVNASAQAQSLPKPPSEPAAALPGNRNLDLLLDIELGATLRFGSRQMLLKEILDLCSGSVVELDRRVQDPVDLLIDGRLIAQGEVVIVGGNYGLRITRVASQGERIACLP